MEISMKTEHKTQNNRRKVSKVAKVMVKPKRIHRRSERKNIKGEIIHSGNEMKDII